MSLRHALLATLTASPMTGYELVKYFDGSVAFVWNAPDSQIYPELRRMERDGLVDVELVPRGQRAQKRRYSISEAGLAELQNWAAELTPYPPERDLYRLKAAHFEQSSYDAARRQLQEHINHYTRALRDWEQMLADLDAHRVPLLRQRLARRPRNEHEAIVSFRRFAFRGEAAKARMEIAWAEEGIALLNDLERRGAALRDDGTARTDRPGTKPPSLPRARKAG
jgi:PadR family transcriptional regulator AphA